MPKKSKRRVKLGHHKKVLMFLVMAALVAGLVWSVKDKNTPSDQTNTSTTTQPQAQNKTFTSSDIGLKFSYPASWQVSQGFSQQTELGERAAIKIKSPGGLIIYIEPSYLGPTTSGCKHNILDKPHNTEACNTLEVLSRQKTELSAQDGKVYFIKALYSGPRQNGSMPNSRYVMFLSSDAKLASTTKPLVGNWLPVGTVLMSSGYISTYVEGGNNNSSGFLNSDEARQAEQILNSISNYKANP